MPLGDTIITRAIVDAIVAKIVKKSRLHLCRFRVSMDIAQGIESAASFAIGKPGAVVAFFPKVSGAVEHSVKTHSSVPVQPVHNFGEVLRFLRLDEIMNVVAHHAQAVELESIFILYFFDGVQEHLTTFPPRQAKLAVVAAHGNVVGVTG